MDKKLEIWRKQINALDQDLIVSLAKRMNIVRKIGKLKKEHGLAPLDEKRWQEVLESNTLKAQKLGLSKDVIKKMYRLIHKYSLEIEKKS